MSPLGPKPPAQPVHSFTPTLGRRSERTPTKWLVSSMQPEKRECVRVQGTTRSPGRAARGCGPRLRCSTRPIRRWPIAVHDSLLGFVGGVVVVLDAVFGQPGDGLHGGTPRWRACVICLPRNSVAPLRRSARRFFGGRMWISLGQWGSRVDIWCGCVGCGDLE